MLGELQVILRSSEPDELYFRRHLQHHGANEPQGNRSVCAITRVDEATEVQRPGKIFLSEFKPTPGEQRVRSSFQGDRNVLSAGCNHHPYRYCRRSVLRCTVSSPLPVQNECSKLLRKPGNTAYLTPSSNIKFGSSLPLNMLVGRSCPTNCTALVINDP